MHLVLHECRRVFFVDVNSVGLRPLMLLCALRAAPCKHLNLLRRLEMQCLRPCAQLQSLGDLQ